MESVTNFVLRLLVFHSTKWTEHYTFNMTEPLTGHYLAVSVGFSMVRYSIIDRA